ncbi:MAG: NAD(+)/NADH kinase [Syntrophomonadaceae bacterium]
MLRILILHKNNDVQAYRLASELSNELAIRGVEVLLQDSHKLRMEKHTMAVDMVFVIGGDGTLLKTARLFARVGTPMLGVNMGRVGFLSSIEPEQLITYVEPILNREYYLENRMMIDVDVIRNGELIRQGTALNDAVIKTRTTHTINISLQVNHRPYTTIRGDGVVCATPTGSTAYSFSAGGPIIDVSLTVLAITPICSQLACSRAVILDADSRLVFELDSEYSTSLALDGEETLVLIRGDQIRIKKAAITANIIQLNPISSSEKILGKSKQIREA